MQGGRRTKIVATIGPASASVSMLTRMIKSGMDVARLNFSHGTASERKAQIRHIRQAAKKAGKEIAIMQDLQGPKVRVGKLPEGGIALKKGQAVKFRTGTADYESEGPIPIPYHLHKDVRKGHRILLDDGRLEAVVTSIRGRVISAKMAFGGQLTSNKGINIPDSRLSASSFTKKDHEDLMAGLEAEVDWVALSFVASEKVVEKARGIIRAKCRSLGTVAPKIMVKIERKEAVEDFIDILNATDGVLLARGDLGVEIPFEEVPIIQKEFAEICRQSGKPMIVATHMLCSMKASPRATRAEVSDVANAVIDHADAVMLSGETAIGEYPNVTIQTMARVIEETEESRLDDVSFYQLHNLPDLSTSLAQSLHVMAENGQIDLIATASSFHPIADTLNTFRPNVPIVMACPNRATARQMMMRSGVLPVVFKDDPGTFIHRMERKLRTMKLVKKQQRVAYVTTTPSGEAQLTIR